VVDHASQHSAHMPLPCYPTPAPFLTATKYKPSPTSEAKWLGRRRWDERLGEARSYPPGNLRRVPVQSRAMGCAEVAEMRVAGRVAGRVAQAKPKRRPGADWRAAQAQPRQSQRRRPSQAQAQTKRSQRRRLGRSTSEAQAMPAAQPIPGPSADRGADRGADDARHHYGYCCRKR
jgi:hypothetical protein